MEKPKCLNCLCLAVCKHKNFDQLKKDCFYIVNFLYNFPQQSGHINYAAIDFRFDIITELMNPPWKEDYIEFRKTMRGYNDRKFK